MLHTTQGIVLHSFKYGDSGIIARILTPSLGLQSYLVQGVRKSKSRIKANLFQPLNLVEMVAYHKEKSGLQHIKEIRQAIPLIQISTDIRKTSIAIFISEILLTVFKKQETTPETFRFIYDSVEKLDGQADHIAVFHLWFLVQLCGFLGFSPMANISESRCFFNLKEGVFQPIDEGRQTCLDRSESLYFYQLIHNIFSPNEVSPIPADVRKNLLHKIIDYYRIHLDGFKEIKSFQVLEAVFN